MVLVLKNLPANAGDAREMGLICGSGRSPGAGNGNLLQYSCLKNSMDRGAWWAIVHGVTKSQTQLSTYAGPQGEPLYFTKQPPTPYEPRGSHHALPNLALCPGRC